MSAEDMRDRMTPQLVTFSVWHIKIEIHEEHEAEGKQIHTQMFMPVVWLPLRMILHTSGDAH